MLVKVKSITRKFHIVLAISLVAALSVAVQAKTTKFIYPNSDWALSKLDSGDNPANAYCALARRFDNDMILTLAHNNQGKGSVALDFQKAMLDTAQTYKIILSAGSGETREFSLRPVSAKAMVIKMGRDQSFFDTLKDTETLSIDLRGQAYELSLSRYNEGQQKLSDCLVKLQGPKSFESSELLSKDLSYYKDQINALSRENSSLRRALADNTKEENLIQRQRMEEKLSLLEQDRESLARKTKALENLVASKQLVVSSLEDELAVALSQIEAASGKSAEMKALERKIQSMSSAHQEREALKNREIASLKETLVSKENLVQSLQERSRENKRAADAAAQIEIEALKDELAVAMARLEAASGKSAEMKALERKIETIDSSYQEREALKNREIASLKETLVSKENLIKTLQDRSKEDTRSANAAAQIEIEALKDELAVAKQQLSQQRALTQQEVERKKNLETQMQNQALSAGKVDKEKFETIQNDLAREKVKLAEQKKFMDEQLNKMRTALNQKNKKIASLEKTVASAMALPEDVAADEIQSQKIRTLEEELDTIKQEYNAKVFSLENVITNKERVIVSLQEKLLNAEKDDTSETEYLNKIGELESGMNRLKSDLKMKKKEIALLNSKLASTSEDQNRTSNYLDTITELKEKLSMKDRSLIALTSQLTEKTSLLEKMASSQPKPENISNIKKELAAVKSESTQALQKKESLISSLREELAERDEMIATIEEQHASQIADTAKNTQEADTNAMKRLSQDLAELREAYGKQKSEYEAIITNLESELAVKDQNLESMKTTSAVNQKASATFAQTPEGGVASLMQKVELLENENEVLRDTINNTVDSVEIADSMSNLAALKSLETEYDALKNEKQALEADLSALRNKADKDIIAAASGDWNLEKATRRFNEAERQIRVMGSKLEKAQAQCLAEKKELEYKMFDPKIARKEQVTRLMQLEKDLMQSRAAWNQEKNQYLEQIAALQSGRPYSGGTGLSAPVSRNSTPTIQNVAGVEPASGAAGAGVNDTVRKIMDKNKPGQLMNAQDVAGILTYLGVSPKGAIRQLDTRDGGKSVSYRWDTNKVFGSAEQKSLSGSNFDEAVKTYLAKIEKRCAGDFAAVPVVERHLSGGDRLSSYDIACVSDQASASASTVFYTDNGLFTVIAHESDVTGMDVAMDARDRLVKGFVN